MERNGCHILAMLFLLCLIPSVANSQWLAGDQQRELMRSGCRDAFSTKGIAPAAPAESRLTSLRAFLKTETGDWRDNTDQMHSSRFGSSPNVDAVVCISESKKATGQKYDDGSSAYNLNWEVKIVGWPQGHLVYSTTLISNPPFSKVGFGGKAGEPPIQRLVQHLVALSADRNILSSLRARIEPRDSETDYSVSSIAVSADGKWLAAGGDSGRILLWDFVTRTLVRTVHDDFSVVDPHVDAMIFSRDARFLAVSTVGLLGKTVRLLEVSTGRVLRKLPLGPEPAGVTALSFVDYDKILTGFSYTTMYQWDVHSGRQVATAAVDRPKAENGSGLLFSSSEAMSLDGGTFAVAWEDGTVTVYEGPKHVMKVLAQGLGSVSALAFSPDGKTLASAGKWGGPIRLWSVASGSALGAPYPLEGSMAFAPSGKMLAVATNDGVVLLDLTLGKEVGHFESEGYVSTVQFSPDGNAVLGGGADGAVRVWQTPLVSELKVQNSRNEDGRVTNWRKRALLIVVGMVALLALVGVTLFVFFVWRRRLSR